MLYEDCCGPIRCGRMWTVEIPAVQCDALPGVLLTKGVSCDSTLGRSYVSVRAEEPTTTIRSAEECIRRIESGGQGERMVLDLSSAELRGLCACGSLAEAPSCCYFVLQKWSRRSQSARASSSRGYSQEVRACLFSSTEKHIVTILHFLPQPKISTITERLHCPGLDRTEEQRSYCTAPCMTS